MLLRFLWRGRPTLQPSMTQPGRDLDGLLLIPSCRWLPWNVDCSLNCRILFRRGVKRPRSSGMSSLRRVPCAVVSTLTRPSSTGWWRRKLRGMAGRSSSSIRRDRSLPRPAASHHRGSKRFRPPKLGPCFKRCSPRCQAALFAPIAFHASAPFLLAVNAPRPRQIKTLGFGT